MHERNDIPLAIQDRETTAYTYNLRGLVHAITYHGGVVEESMYDERGHVDLLTHMDALSNLISSYDYIIDDAGQRDAVIETYLVTPGIDEVTQIDWVYEDRSRITEERFDFRNDDPDTIWDRSTIYTYDLVGNRTERKTGLDKNPTVYEETVTYNYDTNDRLLAEDRLLVSGAATTILSIA